MSCSAAQKEEKNPRLLPSKILANVNVRFVASIFSTGSRDRLSPHLEFAQLGTHICYYKITRKSGHFLARLSFLITTEIYPRAEEKPRTNSPKSPGNTNKDGAGKKGISKYGSAFSSSTTIPSPFFLGRSSGRLDRCTHRTIRPWGEARLFAYLVQGEIENVGRREQGKREARKVKQENEKDSFLGSSLGVE